MEIRCFKMPHLEYHGFKRNKSQQLRKQPFLLVKSIILVLVLLKFRLTLFKEFRFPYNRVILELGAGHPMGPFELADYVGLDTTKFIILTQNKNFRTKIDSVFLDFPPVNNVLGITWQTKKNYYLI